MAATVSARGRRSSSADNSCDSVERSMPTRRANRERLSPFFSRVSASRWRKTRAVSRRSMVSSRRKDVHNT